MPTIKATLTKGVVEDAIRNCAGETYVRDDRVPGFFLYVYPKGKPALKVQADTPAGKAKQIRICLWDDIERTFPDVPRPIDAARSTAADIKHKLKTGERFEWAGKWYGEAEEAAAGPPATDGTTMAQAFVMRMREKQLKSEAEMRSVLKFRFGDYWHAPLARLDRRTLAAKYENTPSCHKAYMYLRALLTWVYEEREYGGNDMLPQLDPDILMTLKYCTSKFKPSKRALELKPHHIKPLWQAFRATELDPYGDLLCFVMLTGMRRSEAAALEWKDIDWHDNSFTRPDSKNGRPVYLPMTNWVREMLERRNADRSHDKYVFGSKRFSATGGLITARQGSKTFASYKDVVAGFTPHQLRKFARHTLSGHLRNGETIVDAILNHAGNSVGKSNYTDRSDVEPLRVPLQEFEDYVLAHAAKPRSNVRTLRAQHANAASPA